MTQTKVVHGIEINAETADIARALLGNRATILTANAMLPPAELLATYDLIVAHPPLSLRLDPPVEFPILGERQFSDLGLAVAAWGCSRLNEHGRVVLILAPSFLWTAQGRGMLEAVHSLGCRVGALFHLPGGSLASTAIASYIVVLERGPQRDAFIGEFSQAPNHQEQLLSNYKRRKPGPQPGLGRLCSLENFRGFEALAARQRLGRLARATGWPSIPASTVIVTATRPNSSRQETKQSPNSFFLRFQGRVIAALSLEELPGRAAQHSYLLEVNPEIAEARYLLHWLNESQVGQATIQSLSHGSVISGLDIRALLVFRP